MAPATEVGTMRRRVWRSRATTAAVDMEFLCFDLHETKEHELRWKDELLLGSRKLPTPVLSGSGSRVFLSPAMPRSTPVSMIQLRHCGPDDGKWLRMLEVS